MNREKVIVICGPTASGKTSLGIKVAKQLNGEIISCDSMQIYKDMTIGTAKPTKEEREEAVHHLVDFVYPNERYSVAEYKKDAENTIEQIIKKGKTPIIVGGTGLYLNSLIYGIDYPEIETDLDYRKMLEERASCEGLENLYNEAKAIDEKAIQKISPNDKKRILRILEIYHSTGKTKTELEEESRKNGPKYNNIIFVLNMERKKLYDRINKRVDLMIKDGLIEEVQNLMRKYKKFPTAMQGLGYKEVVEYLNKKLTKEEMIEKIKLETRRYAKRQITWFKSYKNAMWLDAFNNDNVNIIIKKYLEEA